MNCPVCARSLAPTLSICPSCGAMMNDTVREELQTKIIQGVPPKPEMRAEPRPEPVIPAEAVVPPRPVLKQPVTAKPQTAGLVAPKTSPTLVGFQNKNTSVPDWRLQLQNAVQQRRSSGKLASDTGHHFPMNGGAALKAEPVRGPEPMPEIEDTRVANALKRIEESRKAFLESPVPAKKTIVPKPATLRPFGVVAPTTTAASATPSAMPTMTPAKPKLVAPPQSAPVFREKRDTNKLPPLEMPFEPVATAPSASVTMAAPAEVLDEAAPEFGEIKRIRIKAEADEISNARIAESFDEDIEDLAPFSMRFGAGLFDLIIGLFASMLILSPVAFSRADWFSTSAMLVFAGTTAIVMFIYMTVCLGFFGKTMGMRLFSLELVDAIENEYPTLHQAAISSSLFIVSLVCGGAGFLTMFFNEEKRAAHDLLSGTILVREF